jgi:hypothetical protein
MEENLMKVVDCSPVPEKSKHLGELSEKLDSVLNLVPFLQKTGKGEQLLIAQMERVLSNKYFLIKNASIEGVNRPYPFILVGATGIYLLNFSTQKGIYRAKDDTWSEMKGRNRQFEPVQPNLIKETLELSNRLEDYLSTNLERTPAIHPVLIVLNPGTHVDSIRPAVRIIMMDGLERFLSRLSMETLQMTNEEVHIIYKMITEPSKPQTEGEGEDNQVEKSRLELQALKPVLAIEPAVTKNINTISNKLNFSTRQWVFLSVIAIANILLLITFLIIILLST